MTLWLTRAGGHGEFEAKFLDESRVYLTWDKLTHDLSSVLDKSALRELLSSIYPKDSKGRVGNHSAQIWAFARRMAVGDWIVLPSKLKPAIHIAEIVGPYVNEPNATAPFYHFREVRWIETDVPRSNFDQDLLYSMGAFSTICEIKRNNAEQRIRKMAANQWQAATTKDIVSSVSGGNSDEIELDDANEGIDLEQLARDQIAKVIGAKFMGHGLEWVVEAVLRAQGYTTYRSPKGADKGVDILAAPGPLGFGRPRIAVQVKSGASPIDRPTLDQLIGTMQNVQADQGLLVSWGGFRSSVDRERATQFFRVRLWDQQTLIEQILTHYDKLDDDLRAELPLKRIWTIADLETVTSEG